MQIVCAAKHYANIMVCNLAASDPFGYADDFDPQARSTALVVEDDDGIRMMLDVAPRRHGFEVTVTVAATGDEAVAVYLEDRDAIAVVLDVRVPHLNAPATLAAF